MSRFGVDDDWIARIVEALAADPKVRTVSLFGSRARGGFRSGSDIDLALSAPGLEPGELARLRGRLSGLPLVFKTDLVHMESLPIDSPLIAQIARDGVVLYQALPKAA